MATNRLERGLRATFVGLAVNAILATSKLIAGVAGHSHALIADAVESFADIFSSLIVWRGIVVAAAPPDEDHPYGHGKAEAISAAVVSGMMLIAAAWICVQAILEILQPHHLPANYTLVVLIAVVLIKEGLFRFVLKESMAAGSSAVQTDAWHHRSDAITSGAAAVGISIALIGGPGYESADDWAAIASAGVIAWNAWRLMRPAVNELMDRVPDPEVVGRIRAIAESHRGVAAVEKCFVRKMGYDYFVDMHLEVDPEMSVRLAHDISHEVKDRIRQEIEPVRDVLVHIEPARR